MLVLHDYQQTAAKHLQENPRGGLFLDMGLGKTAATLAALTPEHLPALVVAPKRVAESVWPSETKKWRPDLSFSLAAGSPQARSSALLAETDLVAIGRDNLKDITFGSRRTEFRTLILDELSSFKTRSSQRWKYARNIASRVPHVWGLTGTPASNGLLDLWPQVFLVDPGTRLGPNITTFRSRYFTPGRQLPNGIITEWNLRPGAEEKIYEQIEGQFLSMGTEGRIELPPVTYNPVRIELPPAARTVYKKMKRDLVADMTVLGGEIHTAQNAAVLTNKLSQIAAGFMYPDDADLRPDTPPQFLHREKINAVVEIVEGTGSPVVVFYRFNWEKQQLLQALPQAVPIDRRGALQDWDAGRVPVLVAHPASAGHGLNLQHGGFTIVWTSLTWSLEEWQQGNKRLARQGQKHPVIIHMLIAERTVDESIHARLQEKASVQDALLRHLEVPL